VFVGIASARLERYAFDDSTFYCAGEEQLSKLKNLSQRAGTLRWQPVKPPCIAVSLLSQIR
jgi:hypothetical protein